MDFFRVCLFVLWCGGRCECLVCPRVAPIASVGIVWAASQLSFAHAAGRQGCVPVCAVSLSVAVADHVRCVGCETREGCMYRVHAYLLDGAHAVDDGGVRMCVWCGCCLV